MKTPVEPDKGSKPKKKVPSLGKLNSMFNDMVAKKKKNPSAKDVVGL